jgi:Zinc finger, C3HC4 type (RING finger)
VKDTIKKSIDHLSAISSNTDGGEPHAAPQSVVSEHTALLRTQAENRGKQQRTESSIINSKGRSRSTSRTPSEVKRVQNSSETHRRNEFGWQMSLLIPDPVQDDEKGNDAEEREDLPPPASLLGVEDKENIPPIAGSPPRKSDFTWMKSLILPPDYSQFDQGNHTSGADDDSALAKNTTKAGPSGFSHVRGQEFSWQRSLEGTTLRETEKDIERTTLLSDSFGVGEGSKLERHDKAPSSSVRSDYAWQTALLQQLQEEEELAASVAPNSSGDRVWIVALQKRIQEEERSNSNGHGASSSSFSRTDLDWQLAVQLQAEEVDNDEVFNRDSGVGNSSTFHTVTLPTSTLTAFECGVCGELHNVSEKIELDDCGHAFCKVCLGTFTKTKIEEGRYPIFCPECLPDRTRTTKTRSWRSQKGTVVVTDLSSQSLPKILLINSTFGFRNLRDWESSSWWLIRLHCNAQGRFLSRLHLSKHNPQYLGVW